MSANPIPTNSVSTINGVLNEWVCQSQSQVKESGGAITYQEVFKGPYATGKELLSKIETGDKIDSVHLLMGNKNQLFTAPSCPLRGNNKGVWRLQTIQITEAVAGSHCVLQLLYLADYSGIDDEKLTEDIYQNTWSVSWQSYTVSPYAFCSNPENPINLKVTENEAKDKGKLKASRETIQKYLSQNGTNNVFKNSIKDKETYRLNYSEVLILQKINSNKSAVYHYPIVTHTTVKSGPFNDTSSNLSSETPPKQPTRYDDALGGDLDTTIGELPKECPYTFSLLESVGNKEWQWIKIADDIDEQHTKKTTSFTRREQWMGVVDPDVNFYSNIPFNRTDLSSCRWVVGEL